MSEIGIIPNLEKDKDLIVTKKIFSFLLDHGHHPMLPLDLAEKYGLKAYGYQVTALYERSDFLIVLGGDGTLLRVGRQAAKFNTPLLGINLGTLGFLTDTEEGGAFYSIERVLKKEYQVEKRMMLEAEILGGSAIGGSFDVLNDVCITRGVFSKIIDLKVHVNDDYLDTFRADGIIIATPTGSTAYNLSAGGPILKPDTQMVAITPICPHALHARSIVVSAEDIVMVEVGSNSRGDLLFSADGQTGISLNHQGVVRIKKSKFTASIIKTNHLGFYDILRRKLVRYEG